MITGGVFDKRPALRGEFLECGTSWLAFWLCCMDERGEHCQTRASQTRAVLPSECFE